MFEARVSVFHSMMELLEETACLCFQEHSALSNQHSARQHFGLKVYSLVGMVETARLQAISSYIRRNNMKTKPINFLTQLYMLCLDTFWALRGSI